MTAIDDLRDLLGTDRVLVDKLERHIYGKDASLMRGDPACVVFPTTTDEVSAVVRIAARHSLPVVPRGAGTGLTAGAAPVMGGVVVAMTGMNQIEIDVPNQAAWVGPGVVNLDLSYAAQPHGLHFAPDPSSQSACTIGGNVANNSGGPHCLAEGSTTSHVLGLEFVMASGEVLNVGGLAPDPAGLDIRSLIVGSEGTLGLVTRALVRLLPLPSDARTLLLDFGSVESAAQTVSDIIAAGLVPAALEMMDQRMTQAVENWLHAGLPVDAAAILLAEVVGSTTAVESEAELIRTIGIRNGAVNVVIAKDDTERALLWKGRKSAFGAVAQLAPDYYLHDAVVPRTRLVETMTGIYAIADRLGLTMLNVFHAGDGNLHPLIAFDSSDPAVAELVLQAGAEIVALCLANGGALSGEHGVGVEKRDLMRLSFSELDLDAQARIKDVFDPTHLLNPAKILPSGSRCFDFGGVRREVPEGTWV
ncbi:MAG: FAD-binding protein [Acidimicrobiia bacterium]|nr:FAD-binding protein [Acidimicrobiia bacterium]MDH3462833.1 FAD-binding protein [Acidimicrobiia bacterium]